MKRRKVYWAIVREQSCNVENADLHSYEDLLPVIRSIFIYVYKHTPFTQVQLDKIEHELSLSGLWQFTTVSEVFSGDVLPKHPYRVPYGEYIRQELRLRSLEKKERKKSTKK